MSYSYLLIGDLHLTDRPRDAYRFGIFRQILEWQAEYKPERTIIMGDLCDQKDRHSARLVNRIVDELSPLHNVRILMGNHDYIHRDTPYFRFLRKLQNVHFIDQPFLSHGVCAVPHCRSQDELDECFNQFQRHGGINIVLLHNTFEGAISETGKKLSGLKYREEWPHPECGIYAGDIHRPQKAGKIIYVGAPYHVRFGDNFIPRCLFVDYKRVTELHFNAPNKWKFNIKEASDIDRIMVAKKGDQVKVTVELTREEVTDWKKVRSEVEATCKKRGFEVFGIDLKVNTIKRKAKDVKQLQTPADILASFCLEEGVGAKIKTVGLNLLKG